MRAWSAEGHVEPGRGHGEEADGYGAGFCCGGLVVGFLEREGEGGKWEWGWEGREGGEGRGERGGGDREGKVEGRRVPFLAMRMMRAGDRRKGVDGELGSCRSENPGSALGW